MESFVHISQGHVWWLMGYFHLQLLKVFLLLAIQSHIAKQPCVCEKRMVFQPMQTLSSFNRTEHLEIKKSLDSLNTVPGNLENQVVNQLVPVMWSFPVFILIIFHQRFRWLLLLGKQIFESIYLRKVASPMDPWVRKIPWRRKWQPTLVFFPGKSRGRLQSKGLQRSQTHPSD